MDTVDTWRITALPWRARLTIGVRRGLALLVPLAAAVGAVWAWMVLGLPEGLDDLVTMGWMAVVLGTGACAAWVCAALVFTAGVTTRPSLVGRTLRVEPGVLRVVGDGSGELVLPGDAVRGVHQLGRLVIVDSSVLALAIRADGKAAPRVRRLLSTPRTPPPDDLGDGWARGLLRGSDHRVWSRDAGPEPRPLGEVTLSWNHEGIRLVGDGEEALSWSEVRAVEHERGRVRIQGAETAIVFRRVDLGPRALAIIEGWARAAGNGPRAQAAVDPSGTDTRVVQTQLGRRDWMAWRRIADRTRGAWSRRIGLGGAITAGLLAVATVFGVAWSTPTPLLTGLGIAASGATLLLSFLLAEGLRTASVRRAIEDGRHPIGLVQVGWSNEGLVARGSRGDASLLPWSELRVEEDSERVFVVDAGGRAGVTVRKGDLGDGPALIAAWRGRAQG